MVLWYSNCVEYNLVKVPKFKPLMFGCHSRHTLSFQWMCFGDRSGMVISYDTFGFFVLSSCPSVSLNWYLNPSYLYLHYETNHMDLEFMDLHSGSSILILYKI